MNKTTKKLENAIIKALTVVCEEAKDEVAGFEWLTHTANYANFPNSLVVTCVFADNTYLHVAKENGLDLKLISLIEEALLNLGILIKQTKKHVIFDSQQACQLEHGGNWAKRIEERH